MAEHLEYWVADTANATTEEFHWNEEALYCDYSFVTKKSQGIFL